MSSMSNEEFTQIVVDIASHLQVICPNPMGLDSSQWIAGDAIYERTRHICYGDHIDFYISRSYQSSGKDRFEIFGSYPRDEREVVHGPRASNAPSITVSRNRAAKAIAKDIANRFLPDYFRTLTEALASVAEHNHAYNMQLANACHLALLTGDNVTGPRQNTNQVHLRMKTNFPMSGYVEVSVGGHIEIKIHSVPLEIAEQIIKLMQA